MTLVPLDQFDPRLRQMCAPLTKVQLRDRQQQLEIDALLDFVYGLRAGDRTARNVGRPSTVGLAGNQVGIMKQICAVDLSVGHQGYTDIHILVNPKITWWSKSPVDKTEGCVNFPTTWGVTRRARSVRVKAWDRSGNDIELRLTGWPSVLMQHEYDHLQGRLFIDRLPDPTKAHRVSKEEYHRYRKARPDEWNDYVDVSRQVSIAPDVFQARFVRGVE